MPDSAVFEDRLGSTLCGKWTLERLLGVGGVAGVFLGRHNIGRYDAIKMLHPRLAEQRALRVRFEREAHAVNRLVHPGAVEIRDIDSDENGVPFLVMEYLEGDTLATLAKKPEGVPLPQLLDWTGHLLEVLGEAHRCRIIHRDIKPSNLFILEDGRLKVLDFGIAKMRQDVQRSMQTQEGDLLGTVAYMPPEQVRGTDVDARADLFAVGATMFRLIARRPIHRAPGEALRLIKMATMPPPPLAEVAPSTPPDVCLVVDRALAFDRNERYPSAALFREDVRALSAGEAPPYASSREAPPRRTGHDLPDFVPVMDQLDASEITVDETEEPTRSASDAGAEARRALEVPSVPPEEELVGVTLGGRYQLVSLVGRGGMGSVYEATDPGGRRVAVKVLLPHLLAGKSGVAHRFRREARTAGNIRSPHVVGVLEADIDEARKMPFIVMDLLEGSDLEQHLERVRPLTDEAVVAIFSQACRGLAAAHALDVIHRDIKPANIFLGRAPDGTVTVKLLDFGLAKSRTTDLNQSAQSLTQSGGVLGTPKYASPEQATSAKNVDVRSDIWGLCLSMYEALSGQQPWAECETVGELIVAIVTTDIPPLGEVAPWVDRRLAAIIDKGLCRDVDARWNNVPALQRALSPLGEEPLTTSILEGSALQEAAPRAAPIVPIPRPRAAISSERSVPGVFAGAPGPLPPRRLPRLVLPAALALGLGGAGAWVLLGQQHPAPASDGPAAEPLAAASEMAQTSALPAAPSPAPPTTQLATVEPVASVAPRRPEIKPPLPSRSAARAAPPAPATAMSATPGPELDFKPEWK